MRVLRIDHNSFSKTQNNGKTGEDLSSFIPLEDRFQLFFTPLGDLDDLEFAQSSYLVSDQDVLFKLLGRRQQCGEVMKTTSKNIIGNHRETKFKWFRKRLFRDIMWKTNVWKTKELMDWCKEIRPEIIVLGGSSQTFPFKIARYLSKKLNVPTALYCGDDYIAYYRPTSIWDKIQKYRLRRIYKNYCKDASVCMAISNAMSDTFTIQLGRRFVTIPRPIDIPEKSEMPKNETIVISYFGGLHLNRWTMIVRLAKLVSNAKIRVYSMANLDAEIRDTFEKCNVEFRGGVCGESLQLAIKESDILLHVESDDKIYSSFTRLAVSTKIPEYLAANRFVLGYGPSNLASMKIISDNKIGIVLDSKTNDEELKAKLDRIVADEHLREKYAEAGYFFAKKNYRKEIIAMRFKELLEKACGKMVE